MPSRPPPHDEFRPASPPSVRSAQRTIELLPLIDRAEKDDAAMTALLIDAGEDDARLIGRAFGERIAMLVRERSYSDAAKLLERLSSLGAGSKFRGALAGGLVLGVRPAALMFDAATQAGDGDLAELQEMVDALVDEMVSPAVIGAAVVDNRERRRLVLTRLELRGVPALQGAAAALATAPPEPSSLDLVGILERGSGTSGLETALGHESPRVRQEALKALFRIESPEHAGARCLAAIDGADAQLRRVAVDHAVVARIANAAPRLKRLATAEAFDELEYADKKRILVGLATLGGTAVRDILIRALRHRNLLRRSQIDETRIAAACALAVLRDRETRDEIRALRDRTGPPHRMELDQACLIYERQTAPEEIAAREASARLGAGTPARGLPIAEPEPISVHKAPTRPMPLRPPMTDEEGNIDLDSEPPLLPTSHVSVPHAQGSRTPATRPRTRPPETAPAAPSPQVPEAPLPRAGTEELPADVVDLVSGHRKDE